VKTSLREQSALLWTPLGSFQPASPYAKGADSANAWRREYP